MAELLIKAVSATNPNPTKDERGCWKQGDVVEVREDGAAWGALELIPPQQGGKFVRIRITGVTVAQVQAWCERTWGRPIVSARLDAFGIEVTRQAIRIDVDLLPNNVRNMLNRDGFYENTWSNIRDYVRNKINNETGAGREL